MSCEMEKIFLLIAPFRYPKRLSILPVSKKHVGIMDEYITHPLSLCAINFTQHFQGRKNSSRNFNGLLVILDEFLGRVKMCKKRSSGWGQTYRLMDF